MTVSSKAEETLTVGFVDAGANLLLEVRNRTDQTLRCVEILTVFLKDKDTPGGGPSRVHISFESLTSIRASEVAVVPHKTWIDGKPAAPPQDQLECLKAIPGETKPYALDISWQDTQGKTRYQRIPVGH